MRFLALIFLTWAVLVFLRLTGNLQGSLLLFFAPVLLVVAVVLAAGAWIRLSDWREHRRTRGW